MLGSVIGLIMALLPYAGELLKHYLGGQKNKQDLEVAYQNYILAKSKLFGQSADERDSVEQQQARLEEASKKKETP